MNFTNLKEIAYGTVHKC